MSEGSRRDWVTDLGLVTVGLAAAILTFTTLRNLATACGITGEFLWLPLAWLVPVTVDAAGVVAARVWLKRMAGPEAVAFARVLAWLCIGASVLGNAGEHGMSAYGVAPPWWVVVVVSAVPPAMLGAVVHLAHLVGRTPPDRSETDDGGGQEGSDPGPDPDPELTDEALVALLRTWAGELGEMPSREKVRREYSIGSKRAERLRALAMTPSDQQAEEVDREKVGV